MRQHLPAVAIPKKANNNFTTKFRGYKIQARQMTIPSFTKNFWEDFGQDLV